MRRPHEQSSFDQLGHSTGIVQSRTVCAARRTLCKVTLRRDRPLKRRRFLADVFRHAVWRYFRFSLSFRDVEELMAARGVDVSYETIRCWTIKFGSRLPENRRCRRPLWVGPRHWHKAGTRTFQNDVSLGH